MKIKSIFDFRTKLSQNGNCCCKWRKHWHGKVRSFYSILSYSSFIEMLFANREAWRWRYCKSKQCSNDNFPNLLLKYQKCLHSTQATASWDTKSEYMHHKQFSRPANSPNSFRSIDSVSVWVPLRFLFPCHLSPGHGYQFPTFLLI